MSLYRPMPPVRLTSAARAAIAGFGALGLMAANTGVAQAQQDPQRVEITG